MAEEILMIDDAVFYVGSKYKGRLSGKKGRIHAAVQNQPGVWVVEFPETRSKDDHDDTDDYILPQTVLTKWRPSEKELKKQEGPEVQTRRNKKHSEDE